MLDIQNLGHIQMLSVTLSYLPWWYVLLAVGLSFYYGVRGVVGQRIAAEQLDRTLAETKGRRWKTWEVVLVRYVQDFLFHVVCAIAGFLALFLAVVALQEAKSFADIQSGAAVLIVFCFLLGLVGAACRWPELLLRRSRCKS